MNVDIPVLTMATGDPSIVVVATPPTVARAGRLANVTVAFSDDGAVAISPAEHAAS